MHTRHKTHHEHVCPWEAELVHLDRPVQDERHEGTADSCDSNDGTVALHLERHLTRGGACAWDPRSLQPRLTSAP